MPPPPAHTVFAADRFSVPAPFRSFAVRSEEPRHAWQARAPYGSVHVVRTRFLDPGALASLAADGLSRVDIAAFADIDYANTSLDALAALAPGVADLAGGIVRALQATGVLGEAPEAYRLSLETRVDYLASWGAGFHNDVSRHWSGCLFWLLALDAGDVEFVMPHAGVRLPLAPGDLIVFDQTMAHGLCRPGDRGHALAASFETGRTCRQIFLTGELPIPDAQWAALGAPWLPVEEHDTRGALDLMVAEFDETSGAVKALRGIRDCMKRSTCHVDESDRLDPAEAAAA
jgi:hypothetical protein